MLVQQWPDLDVLLTATLWLLMVKFTKTPLWNSLNADSEVFFMPRIEGAK